MPVLPVIRRFRYMGLLTILTVYILILVGGVVRATGSGMGCPDWPTCFGQWIPPTSEAELPDNYQQIYADRGYLETEFNVRKTWTEYFNRLLGVSTGFLIFLTLLLSIVFLKRDKPVFYISLAAFILVGFQGWLGSQVVASNLAPGMITVHMIVAQIIVALLIVAVARSQREILTRFDLRELSNLFPVVIKVAMGMTLIQMVMGTQVREAIDIIAHQFDYTYRDLWIDNLPAIFLIHRSFSLIILAINLWIIWNLFKVRPQQALFFGFSLGLSVLVIGTIMLGVALDRFNVPAFAQPLHMWMASLIFGVQFFLFIVYRYASNIDDRELQAVS